MFYCVLYYVLLCPVLCSIVSCTMFYCIMYYVVLQVNLHQTPPPLPPFFPAVVLGVIGGVVAVGLLTLVLWKLLTTMHDRREFAKYEKERLAVRFRQVSWRVMIHGGELERRDAGWWVGELWCRVVSWWGVTQGGVLGRRETEWEQPCYYSLYSLGIQIEKILINGTHIS